MSLVSTDLAPINENLHGIRDYAEKLEALQMFANNIGENIIVAVNSASDLAVMEADHIHYMTTLLLKESINIGKGLDKIDKTLNDLLGAKAGGLAAAIAPKAGVEQKKEDKNLSAVISSNAEQTKSAVVDESTETPEFESPAIVKAIDTVADIQKDTNKLFDKFIKTEQKSKQSEKTKSLINKPALDPAKKEKKEKKEKIKFPFNFKQFMGGLGGILRAIFNPVAMVMAFIQKTLPYLLIALAFLHGFWEGIGEELREKFTEIGKKIAIGAAIIFAAFKAGPLLIRALALIFHGLRILYLNIEHAMKMALMKKEMVHETVTFTEERSLNIFKRAKEMITFILEKIFIAFKYVLEFAKFLLAAGIAIIIIGLVILLIVGIIAALVLFAALFIVAIAGIVLIFRELGKIILEIFVAVPMMIIDAVLSLFGGLFKWIFGWGEGPSQENSETDTTSKRVTEITFTQELRTAFNSALAAITEPLNTIKFAVNNIARNMEEQSLVGNEVPPAMRAMASLFIETTVEKQNESIVSAIDRLASISNTTYNSTSSANMDDMKKDISDMKTDIGLLYKLMDKWHNESGPADFWHVAGIGGKK